VLGHDSRLPFFPTQPGWISGVHQKRGQVHRPEFQHLTVPDPGDGSATLTHLTTEEQRAYRFLFTLGRLRIE
ncbi:hypothetical protein QP908_11580, partial [Corynebacterium sp. MSK204]|nr:hypothetical protein [Corynebacterium sp. MSK204]